MPKRGSGERDLRLGGAIGASERSQPPRDRMAPRRRVQWVAGCGPGASQRCSGHLVGEKRLLRGIYFGAEVLPVC